VEIDIDALVARRREARAAQADLALKREEEFRLRSVALAEEKASRRKKLFKNSQFIGENFYREDLINAIESLRKFTPLLAMHWLRHDTWTVSEGLILICGYDPRSIHFDESGSIVQPDFEAKGKIYEEAKCYNARRLDNLSLDNEAFQDIVGVDEIKVMHHKLRINFTRLLVYWNSGDHNEPRYAPKYFIQWAIRKKIEINWLEWSIKHGFYEDETIGAPQKIDKPLSATERNTLLVLIAALCKKAGINHQDRTAATELVRLVNDIGVSLTDDTTRKALRQIPNAMSARIR
jgi:hypothetical protein